MQVARYLHALAVDWEGIRSTQEGVYAPNHPDFEYFQCMTGVILGRLEFLNQKMFYMLSEGEHAWPLVWRYLMLFVEQYFVQVSLEALGKLILRSWGRGAMSRTAPFGSMPWCWTR
jgi:hypothetical protein